MTLCHFIYSHITEFSVYSCCYRQICFVCVCPFLHWALFCELWPACLVTMLFSECDTNVCTCVLTSFLLCLYLTYLFVCNYSSFAWITNNFGVLEQDFLQTARVSFPVDLLTLLLTACSFVCVYFRRTTDRTVVNCSFVVQWTVKFVDFHLRAQIYKETWWMST